MRAIAAMVALAVAMSACGDGSGTPTTPPDGGSVVAEFRTPDGVSYWILLDGEVAEQARRAHESGEHPGIPSGRINPGDGGVNVGHEWHITDVEFADMTIEVCDGNAGYIDELGYEEFVNQHGQYFCPWNAELIALTEHPG